jgi:hypothetical protein
MDEITAHTSNETSSTAEGDGDEDELYSQAVDIIKSEGKSFDEFLTKKITNWL